MTVAIVFTGGTIASRPDAEAGGAVPALRGAEIIARTPELAEIAEVEPHDWGLMPASHMGFPEFLQIAAVVDEALARSEVSGAVVVQGTDTLEESCFAYDLLVRSDKPVIVTGAMRNSAEPDYDGPRNLADAVRCASAAELVGMGTVVVMNGHVIGADQAIKAHATALDAFQPRDGTLAGEVIDGRLVLRERRSRIALPTVPRRAAEPVHVVTVVSGMDASALRLLGQTQPRGFVVAATGTGNTPPEVLSVATEMIERGTVVALTTRCAGGTVAPAYAFPGGGAQWDRAGALLSRLDALKCRVALALGLGAGLEGDDLRPFLRA